MHIGKLEVFTNPVYSISLEDMFKDLKVYLIVLKLFPNLTEK
jgi:hypothetical protein